MNKPFIKYVRKLYKQYEIYHCPNGLYIFKDLIGWGGRDCHLLTRKSKPFEMVSIGKDEDIYGGWVGIGATFSIFGWELRPETSPLEFLKKQIVKDVRNRIESKWWFKKNDKIKYPEIKVYP